MGWNLKKIRPNYSIWLGGSVLILLSVVIAYLTPRKDFIDDDLVSNKPAQVNQANAGQKNEDVVEINWRTLQGLNYKKKIVPEDLKLVLDKHVKIPGFAVPLGDQFEEVEEFLFVPNQMACIHVPAPPPHLVIHVHLNKTLSIEEIEGPLWLSGILSLRETQSVYGAAAFEIKGLSVKPYEY